MTYIAYEEYRKIFMQMLVNFYPIDTSELICKIQSNIYDRIEFRRSEVQIMTGEGQGATVSLVIMVEEGQMYKFVPN